MMIPIADLIEAAAKFSYRFPKNGAFNYSCSIHSKMTGKVVVQ
jgi:plastocyanin